MWIGIGKFATLLLGQFNELRINGARHLAALSENHTPDGIVHHDVAPLALLDGEQIHQSNVLGIL